MYAATKTSQIKVRKIIRIFSSLHTIMILLTAKIIPAYYFTIYINVKKKREKKEKT